MKYRHAFPEIKGKVLFNEPFFKHTTFRIGGPCKIWAEPWSEKDIKKILIFARSKRKKVFIIGMGSNILPNDRGFNGVVIHLGSRYFKKVHFTGTKVAAGAGAMLSYLVNLTCKNGLKGIEGLVGIPGTLGGAIFMNSSYCGNISDCLEEVKVMDKTNGDTRIIKKRDLKLGYRHSNLDSYIILEATLRLKREDKKILLRRKKGLLGIKQKEQPLEYLSGGCVFKNPDGKISAARYIEMLHLKGRRIGDAKISEKHANFIINLKNAKQKDVLRLINFVKRRVKSNFKVKLVPEIIIL